MNGSVWVLYCEHNDYNQHGPVLKAVWVEKPSVDQVLSLIGESSHSKKIETIEQLNLAFSGKDKWRFGVDIEWCVANEETGVML